MDRQGGKVRVATTTALRRGPDIARHVHTHGDGVRAIALWVDDARQAWIETTSRGARSIHEPATFSDDHGTLTPSSLATYADTTHTFVDRTPYTGPLLPRSRAIQ